MATAHPRTCPHLDHHCPPPVRRPSSKRSRNDGPVGPRTGICGQHARETHRGGQPAEPPGSAPPTAAGSPTSRISCSAGGTAGHSSLEQESRPVRAVLRRAGERLDPPQPRGRSGLRRAAGSTRLGEPGETSRSSPTTLNDISTHDARRMNANADIALPHRRRLERTARPDRERRGTTRTTTLLTLVHGR